MNNNRISQQLKDYLTYKRSLGFKLTHEATILKRFANYTISIEYDGPLNTNIVLNWIASGKKSDKTMGRKVEVINTLIYKNVHDRPTPYIYSG